MVGENFFCCFVFILFIVLVIVLLIIGDVWCVMIMLLIVCLCVVGLFILIVISVVIGNGVCCGILIKGGFYFEQVGCVDVIVFDKIGMLIVGCFVVINIVVMYKDWEFE